LWLSTAAFPLYGWCGGQVTLSWIKRSGIVPGRRHLGTRFTPPPRRKTTKPINSSRTVPRHPLRANWGFSGWLVLH